MKLRPIIERPKSVKPIYCCPVCGTFYHSFDHAQSCKDSYPMDEQYPGLKVGDVVTISQGYTWAHQKEWIAKTIPADPKHPSHFRHRDQYVFYFVVTALEVHHDARRPRLFEDNRRAHRGVVSVAGRAICQSGFLDQERDDKPVHAWTTNDGHYGVKRCENQEELQHLVKQVEHLLGKPSTVLLVFGRSGFARKHGVHLANGVGVIDSDYRGDIQLMFRCEDEDTSTADMFKLLAPGQRVAQAILMPLPVTDWVEVAELDDSARGAGGFGSTGMGI